MNEANANSGVTGLIAGGGGGGGRETGIISVNGIVSN